MRTKIGVYIESLIESGWLLALVAVPLFLNVYSQRVFEPEKLGLLRTIATLMAAGGIVLWLERAPAREGAPTPRQLLGHAWRLPLVRPVVLLILSYLLATALSVAPRISFWGSYQRLQGAYTLLCYVIVFASMLLYLRKKEQLSRLITAAILASLPVAMYGLLQHNGLDLLPWAGDVTRRVASTMGNAIFVAAYLIMVIPLTAGRLIEMVRRMQGDLPRRTRLALAGFVILLWAFQVWAWIGLGFTLGLWVAVICTALLMALSPLARRPLAPFALAACYSLILAAQCVTVLFSGSRGPQVGLLGGMLVFALLIAATQRRRALLGTLVAVGLLLAGLLVVINLPDSPLAAVRDLPYVGRLGRVLELERGTGRVRVLIWQGAVEMLADDPARAIVGHGPETMYVAYNPYYPSELAQLEARNASPDRSHNETFDALITRGVLGLAASLALFTGVFYHGLHALGLVPNRRSRSLFGLCALVGGLAGAIAPWLLEGTWRLSGVGLPLGMILGLATYVVLQGLLWDKQEGALEGWPMLLMVALLAALIAHWIEISVGIAIAATHTYFWVYAALVVLLSQRLATVEPLAEQTPAPEQRRAAGKARRSRGRRARGARPGGLPQVRGQRAVQRAQLIAGALLVGLVMCILTWNFTTNPNAESGAWRVLLGAFAAGANRLQPGVLTLGMFWMLGAVFLVGVLVTVAELAAARDDGRGAAWWGRSLGICAAIAGGLALVYALAHAGRLVPPVDTLGLYGAFLTLLALGGLGLAGALYGASERAPQWARGAASLVAALPLAAALILAYQYNITPVRADMVYKQGFRFDGEGNWENAAALYERAAELAPQEDYYWLFAGRARLEYAKTLQDPARQETAFLEALDRLETARALAPLNTDHTANLARTYRAWAEFTGDAALRSERLAQAQAYYQEATRQSPQNAQLYNEWGQTYAMLGNPEAAQEMYERSLALDERYANTYMLLGDLHYDAGEWPGMIRYYEQALELSPTAVYAWSRLAYAHAQIEDWESAIEANQRILALIPNDYTTLRNLAYLYDYAGDYAEAVRYLEMAMSVAPAADIEALRQVGQQLTDKLAQEAP
jgi:tetratricopeptide (TPR) repeat protein